jgi:chromosome segregation ATPase
MVTGNGSGTTTDEREEIPRSLSNIDREIESLRERLGEKDELIADLRTERDRLLAVIETQATQVKQLTDGRPAPHRSWWQRLFG